MLPIVNTSHLFFQKRNCLLSIIAILEALSLVFLNHLSYVCMLVAASEGFA
jgi:hypothetical protein